MRISDWSSDVCSSDLSVLYRRPRLESPHFGDKAARKRGRPAAVAVDMGIADFDIGQPLTTPEYPAMQGESGAAKAADPRRDGDQFVKPRRGVIVDFAVRFPNICTILVKIGARLPPAQGDRKSTRLNSSH